MLAHHQSGLLNASEFGRSLIEDDQLVFVRTEIKFGFGELGPVCIGFEVEVDGRTNVPHFLGKSGLADLSRSQQRYCRSLAQPINEFLLDMALDRPCIIQFIFEICKVAPVKDSSP